MNFYEHTLVAKQDLSSIEIEDIQNKYNDIINNTSGKVIKIEQWGLLNFAKKTKNYYKGIYIHYKFEGTPETLNKIRTSTNIDSSVIKHLTVKYKKLDLEKEYFSKEEQKNEKKK